MKLTDIDLSSLAEVAAAVTLLEHVHRELATGGTPLPELVVNPAPSPACGHTHWQDADAMERFVAAEAEKLRGQGSGEVVMTQAARTLDFGFPTAPALATGDAVRIEGIGAGTVGEVVTSMDAASVFGGAPAQSAAPLPKSASASAGAAASPTAPAAPLASGTGVTALPALAPLPAPSAAAPTAPAALSSPAGGVELDTDGLPWDARIHAGTKRKTADGRWTAKKGINDPDLVPLVVAQLRAQMAAGGVTATAPAPHVKAEPVDALKTLVTLPPAPPGSLGAALGVPQMTLGQLQEAQMLANVTPPVVAQSTTPTSAPAGTLEALRAALSQTASAAPAPTTFQDFMTALTVEVQSGRVPIEALGAVCQPLGGVSALNSKPELIPIAWASLKAKYPGML